jgi:hypothetical protein
MGNISTTKITITMYTDAYETMQHLLKDPLIDKITFLKSGGIKVKFTFAQNKLKFDSIMSLLDTIDKLNGEPIE